MHDSILTNTLLVIVVAWFIIFVVCLITVSKRNDISLPEKIFWAAVIFFAPVLGLVFYLVFGFKKRKLSRTKKP